MIGPLARFVTWCSFCFIVFASAAECQTPRASAPSVPVDGQISEPSQITGTLNAAACHFRDGSKAILLERSRSFYFLILRGRDGTNNLSTIQVLSNGHLDVEYNGGVATEVAIERLFRELRRKPKRLVTHSQYETFARDSRTPRCGRSTFSSYSPW
jgi:hypothetical protein